MMKMVQTVIKYGDAKKAIRESIEKSTMEIGVAIASQAKLLAPVDEGQLRNSISVAMIRDYRLLNDGSGKRAEGLETKGLKTGEAYVGSNSDHTIFMEYGTVKTPAQPFLRPSAELIVDRKTPADVVAKYCNEQMEKELKKRKEEYAKKVGL